MSEIKTRLSGLIGQVLDDYGIIIATLVIGIFIGWYGKLFLADRRYNKQIQLRISEKDQRIAELNCLVLEKLNKVTVDKKDKPFFKQLKNYFKKFNVKKK